MLNQHQLFKGRYEAVNVAGEGDVEKTHDDALAQMLTAIAENPRTITLSCGKFTAGVTVKDRRRYFSCKCYLPHCMTG